MVGINCFDPANLIRLLFQLACFHCSLHSEVRIIFARIGTTPIRLPSISFQHRHILPCISLRSRPSHISITTSHLVAWLLSRKS